MKHIREISNLHFTMNNKAVIITNNSRHILKVHQQYFSNYPLLFVILKGVRYQITDKTFDFQYGIY